MKDITSFNTNNNGQNSKLNVHFSNGTQITRTIEAFEAIKLAKLRQTPAACEFLTELLEKYAEPQQKPEVLEMSTRGVYGFGEYWASIEANKSK